MKILQINMVHRVKSTGRTCWELDEYLKANGHESVTAYGHGARYDDGSYRINSKLEYYLHNVLSRLTGLEGYFSYFATRRFLRFVKKYDPDIIHLRNLHGHYLNLPLLFRFLRKTQKPVVMHLHDCWIFTGKCAHPTYHHCDKWLSRCKGCPSKKAYPTSWLFDFSKKMFRDKKKWFSALRNVRVVGVSDWTAGEGKKSFLGEFPVSRIYNWIDTKKFYRREGCLPGEFGLDGDKFTIVCVGASWTPDSAKYQDVLKLADRLDDDMQILLVGAAPNPVEHRRIVYAGFTNDTERLAKLYSVGDVYIHLSGADTFGKVIAEAMACGLPAIVYDVTACPEIAGRECGFAVAEHDVDAMLEKIRLIKASDKSLYVKACINKVTKDFDYETNCRQTEQFYIDFLESVKKQ